MKPSTPLLVLLFFSAASFAQEQKVSKIPVNVYQQCSDDPVGQRIAFKIREELNTSTSMVAVDSYGESLLQVSLVCLSPEVQDRGNVSRYSYQVTLQNFKGIYDFSLTHGIGTCGGQRVAECAEGIVANVDQAVSELRNKIQDGSFKWPN